MKKLIKKVTPSAFVNIDSACVNCMCYVKYNDFFDYTFTDHHI